MLITEYLNLKSSKKLTIEVFYGFAKNMAQ